MNRNSSAHSSENHIHLRHRGITRRRHGGPRGLKEEADEPLRRRIRCGLTYDHRLHRKRRCGVESNVRKQTTHPPSLSNTHTHTQNTHTGHTHTSAAESLQRTLYSRQISPKRVPSSWYRSWWLPTVLRLSREWNGEKGGVGREKGGPQRAS